MSCELDRDQAVKALIESANFAFGVLRAIEFSGLLGVGSLAGKAIEAGSRLRAGIDLIYEIESPARGSL